MENRSAFFSVTGLGALLAAFSVWTHGGERSGQRELTEATTNASTTRSVLVTLEKHDRSQLQYSRGHQLLAEYLNVETSALLKSTRAVASPSGPVAEKRREKLRILIATIPDPHESHLDWLYDAYLESLQRAFASAQYLPDRFWLPAKDDSLRLVTPSKNSVTYPLHDLEPGAMLFRSVDGKELVLLYVIYEIPTSGIHKYAFLAAVRERNRLFKSRVFPSAPGEIDTLRIIGPSFSGSVESLRIAIEQAQLVDTTTHVKLVTGAATNVADVFSRDRVTFRSTVHTDRAMMSIADVLLHRLNIRADEVAVLSESATQYGQAPSDSTATRDHRVVREASETSDSLTQVDSPEPNNTYAQYTFPLNIAVLRSNFVRENSNGALSTSLLGTADPGPQLSLAEAARPRESPAVVAPRVTVPSMELALREIKDGMERHGIRAVILRATDVRDKLMLAQELKRDNRDLQLIILENHLLLSRPDYAQYLRGALVISTYPMSLENQWWSPEPKKSARSRIAFSADAAIGVFNATLTHLGRPEMRKEYSRWAADSVARVAVPPIWVSIVARDHLVPLTAFKPRADEVQHVETSDVSRWGTDELKDREHADAHIGMCSYIVAIGGILLLAITLASLLCHEDTKVFGQDIPRLPGVWKPRRVAAVRDDRAAPAQAALRRSISDTRELIFSGMLLNGVAAMVLSSSAPVILSAKIGAEWTLLPAHILTGVLIAQLALVVYVVLVSYVRAARASSALSRATSRDVIEPYARNERWAIWLLGISTFGATIAVVMCLGFAYLTTNNTSDSAAAFALRVNMFASGVSPFAPVTLLSLNLSIWAWWQIQQVRSVETQRTPFEYALDQIRPSQGTGQAEARTTVDAGEGAHIRRMTRADERIIEAFTEFLPARLLWIPASIITASIWMIATGRVSFPDSIVFARFGFAALAYDLLLLLGPVFLLLSIIAATIRLYKGWKGVDELSSAIAEWPLLNAFARLRREVARLTRTGLFGPFERETEQLTENELAQRWKSRFNALLVRSGTSPSHSMDAAVSTDVETMTATSGSAVSRGDLRRLRTNGLLLRTLNAWREFGTRPEDVGDMPSEAKALSRVQFAELRSAEDYLAFEAVVYVESILLNIRRLALFLLVSLITAVLLVGSYPLAPGSLIKSALVIILLFAVAVLFTVMTGMSKNALLSRLTGTDPGKVTWDTSFILNVVLFAILPLLVLASAEFPGFRDMFFSWMQPALRSFTRAS